MTYIVAQLGARMHYAVPRILHGAGMLERFFTDIYANESSTPGARPPKWMPGPLRRLAGRHAVGVPSELVRSFPWFGVRYAAARYAFDSLQTHIRAGRRFCELVAKSDFGRASATYTFNSAGLELLRAARKRKMRTVSEQTIVPYPVERSMLAEETTRFPEWAGVPVDDRQVAEFASREAAEWDLADVILCASAYVRESIGAVGGPMERCVVVPYGVQPSSPAPRRPSRSGRKLRVLTVGTIGLRKGSQYVLQAATEVAHLADFRMIGPIQVSGIIEQRLRRAVDLVGPIPRADVTAHYRWADVFLLPSLCEGSAIATYEALAAALPVICTPNTGSVVRHGEDGFIVPVRDVAAIVQAVTQLAGDESLWRRMASNAEQRAREFALDRYSERLLQALDNGRRPRG